MNAAVQLEVIPNELKSREQFVLWRYVTRDGKRTKPPYQASGALAASTNSATWAAFADVVRAFEAGGFEGIGFVLTDADDYTAFDLDHCRDGGTGEIAQWAREIIEILDSYTEITPSNEGVRILVRAALPPGGRRTNRNGVHLEMYDESRYVTLTGRRIDATPPSIKDRQQEVERVHASYFEPPVSTHPRPAQPVPLDDVALLERARGAKNGRNMDRLLRGDWDTAYGSQSEADLALCSHLVFWTGGDGARVDRLFRRSGLFRAKWDRRSYSNGETYGEHTVNFALAGATQYYTATPSPSVNGSGPDGGSEEDNEHLTDLGNARRLVSSHGADLHYCHPWRKWLVWDGRRWAIDETGEVLRRAKESVASIYAEAAAAPDPTTRKALADHAKRSESEARIAAMIALAESEPGIPIRPADLDSNPWALNVQNGTLDLTSGKLREHRREDLITKLAPANFEPASKCPTFEAFLARIMGDKADLLSFLKRAIGYSLTGVTSEEILLILYGTGDNGKTTLLELLRDLLGDYAASTPPETFVGRRDGTIPNDIARLRGIRFVSAAEAEEGKSLSESLVKRLTGRDTVTARFMRGEWFDFRPEFTPWLATNHKPNVRGRDKAIWDRLKLLPFLVSIPEAEQDKELPDKLRREQEGVLAWAIDGCLEWRRDGLGVPQEVATASERYRAEQDTIAAFIEDACTVREDAKATARALYADYRLWCQENGEDPIPQRNFGTLLGERGFTANRTGQERWWHGIGLVTQPGLS